MSKRDGIIENRFRKDHQISKGVFGDVFIGTDLEKRIPVAIKVEKKQHRGRSTLKREMHIYGQLTDRIGFPEIYWTGQFEDANIMVMEILGPDLKTLVPNRARGPTGMCPSMVAKTMIYCLNGLEYLHSRDYLHQDIKPNNMTLARGTEGCQVYLVDLGIAKRFRERGTHQHIPYTEDHKMVGTVHYASVNNHLGIELSRRDDLESLAYVALYFLRPGLPWASMEKGEGKTRRAKWSATQELKMRFTGETLFEHQPSEFAAFLSYAWGLGFDEKPNYEYLRELFREVIRRENPGKPYTEEILEEEIPRETLDVYKNWRYKDWGLDIEKSVAKARGAARKRGSSDDSSSSYAYYYTSSSS